MGQARFDKTQEAGRKSDPKAGGGYADIKLVNGMQQFSKLDKDQPPPPRPALNF